MILFNISLRPVHPYEVTKGTAVVMVYAACGVCTHMAAHSAPGISIHVAGSHHRGELDWCVHVSHQPTDRCLQTFSFLVCRGHLSSHFINYLLEDREHVSLPFLATSSVPSATRHIHRQEMTIWPVFWPRLVSQIQQWLQSLPIYVKDDAFGSQVSSFKMRIIKFL